MCFLSFDAILQDIFPPHYKIQYVFAWLRGSNFTSQKQFAHSSLQIHLNFNWTVDFRNSLSVSTPLDTPSPWPALNCSTCAGKFYWRSDKRQEHSGSGKIYSVMQRQKDGKQASQNESERAERKREKWCLPCSDTDKQTAICHNSRQFILGT